MQHGIPSLYGGIFLNVPTGDHGELNGTFFAGAQPVPRRPRLLDTDTHHFGELDEVPFRPAFKAAPTPVIPAPKQYLPYAIHHFGDFDEVAFRPPAAAVPAFIPPLPPSRLLSVFPFHFGEFDDLPDFWRPKLPDATPFPPQAFPVAPPYPIRRFFNQAATDTPLPEEF